MVICIILAPLFSSTGRFGFAASEGRRFWHPVDCLSFYQACTLPTLSDAHFFCFSSSFTCVFSQSRIWFVLFFCISLMWHDLEKYEKKRKQKGNCEPQRKFTCYCCWRCLFCSWWLFLCVCLSPLSSPWRVSLLWCLKRRKGEGEKNEKGREKVTWRKRDALTVLCVRLLVVLRFTGVCFLSFPTHSFLLLLSRPCFFFLKKKTSLCAFLTLVTVTVTVPNILFTVTHHQSGVFTNHKYNSSFPTMSKKMTGNKERKMKIQRRISLQES